MYTQSKKNSTYGIWNPFQEGGQMDPMDPANQQVANAQQEAQAFLEAFAQLSPEAQQIVHQAIMQQ